MWSSRDPDGPRVDCPACGRSVPRRHAREYDKFGDRWDRRGKSFEHLCKACHEALCHQSRRGLEDLLVEVDAGELDDAEFVQRYTIAVEERESIDN